MAADHQRSADDRLRTAGQQSAVWKLLLKFCVFLQLQRNILATCPRVTRFKIDWGDTEASENVAPSMSTESESNQMLYDGDQNRPFGAKDDSIGLAGVPANNFDEGVDRLGDSNQMVTD